jgi:transcriptional regulator
MYIPRRYQVTDPETVAAFLAANDFATLVSYDGTRPIATHLLLALDHRADGSLVLNGHMARANPQWHTFDPEREVLSIFSGPHTYVSPRWYNHVNVPTWNYTAAHVYGRPRVISADDELRALLRKLVDKHEAGSGAVPPYTLDTLPEDFLVQQMKAIAGFRIEVTRIEVAYKLSQNRDAESYDNVVRELGKREDDNSLAVSEEMARRRETLFGA